MKQGFFIALTVLLFSCGGGAGEEQETVPDDTVVKVDSGTVAPIDSVPPVEQVIVLNDVPKTKEVSELLKYFKDKYVVNYQEIHPEELKVHVLSRFSCDKKYTLYLQKKMPVQGKKQEVFPVAELHAYVYKDSAQCANAVNNWLNCFGDNCEVVQAGEPVTLSSAPGYYILNEKNIVCLDHKPEFDGNNWRNMHADLKKLFVSKRSRIIEVKTKGELVWVQ